MKREEMTRLEVFSLANVKLKSDKSKQQVFNELVNETGFSERSILSIIRHIPSVKTKNKYVGKRYWSILLLLILISIEVYQYLIGEVALSYFWLILVALIVPFQFIGMYSLSSTFYLSAAVFSGVQGYQLLKNPGFNEFSQLNYVEFVVCVFLLISGLVMRGRLMDKYTMTKIQATGEKGKTNYKVVFED